MNSILILIFLFAYNISFSQTKSINIYGTWTISDVKNNVNYLGHGIESRKAIEDQLKQNYIHASVTFLTSNKLVYKDKYNCLETDKEVIPFIGLQDFNWELIDNRILLIELSTNQIPSKINIILDDNRIIFDYIGIIFILEKLD